MAVLTRTNSNSDIIPPRDIIFSSSPSEESLLSGSPNSSPTISKFSKHHTLDRQPVRLKTVKKQSDSAPDLKATPSRYNRSYSEMGFNQNRTVAKQLHNHEGKLLFDELLFSSIATKIYFNETKAASELFGCYRQFPQSRETLIQKMIETRLALSSERHLKRMDAVITMILKHKGGGNFIWKYFTSLEKSREEVGRFAENAVRVLSKEKDSSARTLAMIERITRREIKLQKRETLFRENNFSSALCREYGMRLWDKDLSHLSKTIQEALQQTDLASISLDPTIVSQGDETLSPEVLDQKFDEQAQRFSVFARSIISQIFKLNPPEELQKMLTSRRTHIIDYLNTRSLEGEDVISSSRIFISEILYLRLVNGKLLSIDLSPIPHSILVSLSKVLQCLAKEAPFGIEKQDPVYERLNPLFEEFIKRHRRFVDKFSLPNGQ